MTEDRVDLYRHVPPPGQPITMEVQPFPVEYSILEEEEINWAVRSLCLNRSGGPLGMRAEYLFQWLISATQDDTSDATN